MKRYFIAVLLIILTFSCINSAIAEPKLSVKNKNLITFEGDWKGYFFAKVENTGDSAGYIEYGGKLVGFNADDEIMITEDYVGSYPNRIHLDPGEYAYIREYFLEDALKTNTIVDYKFSIKAETNGNDYSILSSQATLDYLPNESYSSSYVYVTFTNTTSSVLYGFAITVAIYDQNNELVFVNGDSTESIGVHPGSTITVKIYIDSDLVDYYERNKIIPTTVDAIVYVIADL